MSSTKIKIRGHESFYIREGWLRKGIVSIVEQPDILSNMQVAIDIFSLYRLFFLLLAE